MPKIVSFTPDQEAEIVRLYTEKHLRVMDIARLLGCSSSPILRVLRDQEVPMRPQGSILKTTRNQKILDLKDAGHNETTIARTLNISRQRVNQIITRGY